MKESLDYEKGKQKNMWLTVGNIAYLLVSGTVAAALPIQIYNLITSGTENELFDNAVKDLEEMITEYLDDPRVNAYKEYSKIALTQRNLEIETELSDATRELIVKINTQTNSIVKQLEALKIDVASDDYMPELMSSLEEFTRISGGVEINDINSVGSNINDFANQTERIAAEESSMFALRWGSTVLQNLENLLLSITSNEGVVDTSLNASMNDTLAMLKQLEYVRQALGGDLTSATIAQEYKKPNGSYSSSLLIRSLFEELNYKVAPRGSDFLIPLIILTSMIFSRIALARRRRRSRNRGFTNEHARVQTMINNNSANGIKTTIVASGQPIDLTKIEANLEMEGYSNFEEGKIDATQLGAPRSSIEQ